jgi:hypothetical protein
VLIGVEDKRVTPRTAKDSCAEQPLTYFVRSRSSEVVGLEVLLESEARVVIITWSGMKFQEQAAAVKPTTAMKRVSFILIFI